MERNPDEDQARRSPSSDAARIGSEDFLIRRAVEGDLAAIVGLLADDPLGSGREAAGDLAPYRAAFASIDADPSELLVVAVDPVTVVATMQLSFLPNLSHGGTTRAQIEAVRVAAAHRRKGLGEWMLRWAIDESRRRGCGIVQLTTDKTRSDAQRFYASLGFIASHEGMKLVVGEQGAER